MYTLPTHSLVDADIQHINTRPSMLGASMACDSPVKVTVVRSKYIDEIFVFCSRCDFGNILHSFAAFSQHKNSGSCPE